MKVRALTLWVGHGGRSWGAVAVAASLSCSLLSFLELLLLIHYILIRFNKKKIYSFCSLNHHEHTQLLVLSPPSVRERELWGWGAVVSRLLGSWWRRSPQKHLGFWAHQMLVEGERMEDIDEEAEAGLEEEVLGSSSTMEKVAAAKQFIENHYRTQMKNIQERRERYTWLSFIFCFPV